MPELNHGAGGMTVTLKLADEEDRDRLIHILESSLDVHKATQFFAWTQGPLQSLLPHEILICGMPNGVGHDLKLRFFTATRYFKQEHFEAACNPSQGLLTRSIRHWHAVQRPCLIPTPPSESPCDPDWEEQLRRLELRNMAAHGLLSPNGGIMSWFGICRVPQMSVQVRHVMELIMPCLTATYARVLQHEGNSNTRLMRICNTLSGREVQVLELVMEGCSNAQVAERLNVSIMTAKNHMQNIRRKLNVRTRGQAVAEGLRLGLILPGRKEG